MKVADGYQIIYFAFFTCFFRETTFSKASRQRLREFPRISFDSIFKKKRVLVHFFSLSRRQVLYHKNSF